MNTQLSLNMKTNLAKKTNTLSKKKRKQNHLYP